MSKNRLKNIIITLFGVTILVQALIFAWPFEKKLISNEYTAISICESLLAERYGQDAVESNKPFTASFSSFTKTWTVFGTLPQYTFGRAFKVIISAQNGKVLYIGAV